MSRTWQYQFPVDTTGHVRVVIVDDHVKHSVHGVRNVIEMWPEFAVGEVWNQRAVLLPFRLCVSDYLRIPQHSISLKQSLCVMKSIEQLIGQKVVLDAVSTYVFLGLVDSFDHGYVVLTDADVHDLRDSTTTRERYVIEARTHGIRPNRKKVHVDLSQIVSISPLADVIE